MITDAIFVIMAKFEQVKQLPESAMTLAEYAHKNGQHRSYPAVKYGRHIDDPERYSKPPYVIVNFKGHNYIIPDEN